MTDCIIDSDCGRFNYCDQDELVCKHDELFTHLGLEIFCYILAAILLGLHNAGGLGGGTVKIFILMMFLNYSLKEATAYTYPFVIGSKIADNLVLVTKKHPVFKQNPLINYNVVLIFLPGTLLGSFIGASFSPVIPYIVVSIIQILFLAIALFMTSVKVKHMFQEHKLNKKKIQEEKNQIFSNKLNSNEKLEKMKENEIASQSGQEKISAIVTKADLQSNVIIQQEYKISSENNQDNNICFDQFDQDKLKSKQMQQAHKIQSEIILQQKEEKQIIDQNQEQNLKCQSELQIPNIEIDKSKIQEINQNQNQNKELVNISQIQEKLYKDLYNKQIEYEKKTPYKKIGSTFGIVVVMFFYYFLQGGKGASSPIGIEMCSSWYWAMYGVQFIVYGTFFYFIAKMIKEEESVKVIAKHAFVKFESHIGKIGHKNFCMSGFFCGLITGIIGFGGAISLVPIMAILGLHPRQATATTSFLTCFYASISAFIALLGGALSVRDFFIMFGIGLFGAFVSTNVFNKIMEKLRLESFSILITASLQFIMLLGTIALWVTDLVQEPFSFQTQNSSYC